MIAVSKSNNLLGGDNDPKMSNSDELLFESLTGDPNDVLNDILAQYNSSKQLHESVFRHSIIYEDISLVKHFKTDASVDYLFDYFMNEDKFKDQLAANNQDTIETTMLETTIDNNYNEAIFTKKDYYTHSLPPRRNPYADHFPNVDKINDQSNHPGFICKQILENISDQIIATIKSQYSDNIFDHFDYRICLFKKSVCKEIAGIEDINNFSLIKNNRLVLTILVLYFMNKIWLRDFHGYLATAMSNKKFSELINDKTYNLEKFFE